MISRAVGLRPDQVARALPFFCVYLLLFTALTIADGVVIVLFAGRMGADRLPLWYAATALVSLAAISLYLTQALRRASPSIFAAILGGLIALFLATWLGQHLGGGVAAAGALLVIRELGMTLVLMHFGTFLQDYFRRDELNHMLPVIYAGGRVGGIAGGGLLGPAVALWGAEHLIPGVAALLAAALAMILWIVRRIPLAPEEPAPAAASAGDAPPAAEGANSQALTPLDFAAPGSFAGRFLRWLWNCPLLFWMTCTTLAFVCCRWLLAYQYTRAFETSFSDEAALAGFMGRYTQVALLLSLGLQLFVVKRLVARSGVAAVHHGYSLLVGAGLLANLLFPSLAMAVACRFLESELRFGLRNPVNQMMVNRFSRRERIVVRGWSLGWLIPLGTLVASGLIAMLLLLSGSWGVSLAGGVAGIVFAVASWKVGQAFNRVGG